jgi:glucosamine--fructose-6-phosphate aminotransferase (isomerizing)
VAVVHNVIIENYLPLKEVLKRKGHIFTSETDTEIISHLIDELIQEGCSFLDAVRMALDKIKGSYALGILFEGDEQCLIAARKESPLVIGLGEGEYFIASDVPPVLPYTKDFIFMEDGEVAILSPDGVKVFDGKGEEVLKEPKRVNWSPLMAEKGGYKHFMLKEIFEQPRAVIDTIRGRLLEEDGDVVLEDVHIDPLTLKKLQRICLIACGTSYHAALVGKFLIEGFCRIPVEADIGSEFRYRNPILGKDTLLVAISQSGETADTLAAMREGKRQGAKTLAICNVLESSLARDSDEVIYTHAGPEIGVASTKTFATQLVTLFLLSLRIGRELGLLSAQEGKSLIKELIKIPHRMEEMLRSSKQVAEMKHGPIALIDREMPVVVLATKNEVYEKVISNIEEVKAREGKVIALASPSDREIAKKVDDLILIPETIPSLTPMLLTIPLQLLAYYMADFKGTDVDQPRNLAKSVTVE